MAETIDIRELNERIERQSAFVTNLTTGMDQVIVGQKHLVESLLIGLLSDGHVLLEGVPGLAKTLAIKTLASLIDAKYSRIQFTPDLLPADVIGTMVYSQKDESFKVQRGPIFANFVLADEINRATPRTQSALLQCMEEKQVTIDGELFLIDKPFIVLATQNPVETAGTYPLPEAQLDRFMIKLSVGYSDRESEMQILDNSRAVHPVENLTAVTDKTELLEMMNRVENIKVNEAVRGYIADIGNASRHNSEIKLGLSTRGLIALKNMSQARAALRGREFVTPDDVKTVAPYVCVHRLICRSTVMRDPDSAKREILDKMIKELPVPTEQI